ncbi:MAG: hypothetical protein IJ403_08660 [Oscillospiraceae bacterium]|nr:hypothetical protein [Oscillospiraceae bacterium]
MQKSGCAGYLCLVLAACLLVGLLLTGCSDPVGRAETHKDLTLILPADFLDISGSMSLANGPDFVYGRHSLVFQGLAESKESLKEMTLREYTDQVISANKKTATPKASGAGFVFTYEADVDDTVYSYTVATYEAQENFWILQFFCPKDTLAENQPEIDIILEGIQPK